MTNCPLLQTRTKWCQLAVSREGQSGPTQWDLLFATNPPAALIFSTPLHLSSPSPQLLSTSYCVVSPTYWLFSSIVPYTNWTWDLPWRGSLANLPPLISAWKHATLRSGHLLHNLTHSIVKRHLDLISCFLFFLIFFSKYTVTVSRIKHSI